MTRPARPRGRNDKHTRGKTLRLTIGSLAPGGDGVAHVEIGGARRAVFVPLSAPGDVLDADVDLTTTPARGSIRRLLEPSVQRAEPPCPSFFRCGGCALMHLTPEARANARTQLVLETVVRALAPLSVEVTHHAAPAELGYRTRARLSIVGGRPPVVGFHQKRSKHVAALDACIVLDPRLAPALTLVRDALSGAHGSGEASVSLGASGLPVVALTWEGELPPEAFARFDAQRASGAIAGARIQLAGARAPATIGDTSVSTTGADGEPLELAALGFAQANPAVSRALGACVAELARTAGRRVLELHAGAGNLTVALARGAAAYVAVESDGDATELLRKNLARRGIRGVRIVTADAERVTVERDVDLVVLDPPRTGARGAATAIAASRAREVIYVSCDPATLARDARVLVGAGFAPVALHAFDMFPQTAHVESVLHLRRDRLASSRVARSHPPTLITLARRSLASLARPVQGDTLLAAVSGGPDSMALLSVLARLREPLGFSLAAHGVDHGLRADADEELTLAASLADALDVPFSISRVAVARGGNLQARAREARYEALRFAARDAGASRIATGHHADDRAETVLLRLLSGSGPRGLACMPEASDDLVRPLLRARRADVLAHLARHAVRYAEDPSNEDPRYLRVRVRRELLPLLEALSPSIVLHLNGLADDLGRLPDALPTVTRRAHRASAAAAAGRPVQVRLRGGRDAHVTFADGRFVVTKEESVTGTCPDAASSPGPTAAAQSAHHDGFPTPRAEGPSASPPSPPVKNYGDQSTAAAKGGKLRTK